MSMKKFQIITTDQGELDYRKICELSLNQQSEDFYFIDKSYPGYHISFHKDGTIWLKSETKKIFFHYKGQKERKIKLPIKEEKSIKTEKFKLFLSYLPVKFSKYPIAKHPQKKYVQGIVKFESINQTDNLVIKLFKGDIQHSKVEVLTTDHNIKEASLVSENENGVTIKKQINFTAFRFKNQRIYLDIIRHKKPKDIRDVRIAIIYEPNPNIDFNLITKKGDFKIDLNLLRYGNIIVNSIRIGIYEVFYIYY